MKPSYVTKQYNVLFQTQNSLLSFIEQVLKGVYLIPKIFYCFKYFSELLSILLCSEGAPNSGDWGAFRTIAQQELKLRLGLPKQGSGQWERVGSMVGAAACQGSCSLQCCFHSVFRKCRKRSKGCSRRGRCLQKS